MSIRLNKLLASRGIASRRKCDVLIESGAVRVNGKVVRELGVQVEPERDRIEVDGRPIPKPRGLRYYVLNKPVGVITTLHDPSGRRSVADLMPRGTRLFPVGRLDADSSGILILTNDGDLAHHLMHPRYGVDKVYRVRLDEKPSGRALQQLRAGVRFAPGLVSSPARVRVLRNDPGDVAIEITLHEGRHRQVRLMFEAIDHKVKGLHRLAYGPLRLEGLERGLYRELSEEEVKRLRRASARPRTQAASAWIPKRSAAKPKRASRPATPRGEQSPPRRREPAPRRTAGAVRRSTERPIPRGRSGRPMVGGRSKPAARPSRSSVGRSTGSTARSGSRPTVGRGRPAPRRGAKPIGRRGARPTTGRSAAPVRVRHERSTGGRSRRPARGGTSRPARSGTSRPARGGTSRPARGRVASPRGRTANTSGRVSSRTRTSSRKPATGRSAASTRVARGRPAARSGRTGRSSSPPRSGQRTRRTGSSPARGQARPARRPAPRRKRG